ncbi:MBL fold metallo-hydrolase [Cryptosporangium aurantiacum]|nr:MBL fold metallo-hydrolase [Cryptosporangium aurantiacum]
MPTSGSKAPAPDELEVSIFGPGKGESILVHLGDGQWMIVDSCRDQFDGRIPPLDYLRNIGVDPGNSVQLIVGTHAHDDHIAGMAAVVEACPSASLVCSAAVSSEEFYALAATDKRVEEIVRVGVYKEYRRIFDIVRARGRTKGQRRPLVRATEQLPLLSIPVGNDRASVLALSPSQEAITRSLQKLANGALVIGQTPRPPAADPNELAVALWIEVGDRCVLLGADLLNGPAACGWQAVLDWHRPPTKAEVIKVPHHGAPNAHWRQVWTDLVVPGPLALMTPYRGGATKRPAPSDIVRLLDLAPRSYITASPRKVPRPRGVRSTAALINQLGKNVQDPWGRSGQVRARTPISDNAWSVTHVPPASELAVYR